MEIPNVQCIKDCKTIADYKLPYTLLNMDFGEKLQTVFPRVGYLVFNLFIGEQLYGKFLNYSKSQFYANRLLVTGLFSQSSLVVELNNKGRGYAILVHPVIGYHFLKTPMHEFTDRQVRVSDTLVENAYTLKQLEENEQLESIDNVVLTDFLHHALPDKRIYENDPIYHAVNRIIEKKGIISIKGLAHEFCMSERTLNRQFDLKVGVSPQCYAKTWQLHHATKLLINPQRSLSEVAYASGYYDVAHLARDFRNKISLPPSTIYKNSNELSRSYLEARGMI